jgi:asparagine synthase (glutamine-hydrolysing)
LLADKYDFTSYQTLVNEFVLLNDLEKLVWHQEMPIASASPVAQWEVMKLAHRHKMKVLLDGQGADETLAGYTHYFRPYFKELIGSNFSRFISEYRFFKKNQRDRNIFGYDFLLELFMPDLRRKLAHIRRNSIQPSHMQDLGSELLPRFRHYDPPFDGIKNLQSSLHSSTFNYGLEKLLSFADRNSMAFSLEVRLPYLDHKLVEFLFSLPSDLKLNQGWTKYLLRLSYSEQIPAEISWRTDKLGYEPPQETWMNNPLIRRKSEESIRSLQEKGFIKDPDPSKTWIYLIADVFLKAFFENGSGLS